MIWWLGEGSLGGSSLNGAANGFWTVTVFDPFIFTLDSSAGAPGGDTWSGSGTFIRWSLTGNSSPVQLLAVPVFPNGLIGKRFIFDPASPTVNLRNASFPVVAYDAKHVIFQADPGTIAAGDFGRFVEPAVFVGEITTARVASTKFVGISAQNILLSGTSDQLTACEQTAIPGELFSSGSISVANAYLDETGTLQFCGVGVRTVTSSASITGTAALTRLYHAVSGLVDFGFKITTARGGISDGYYGNGILLTDCGGKGGYDAIDGAFSIGAASSSFMRGPRVLGSPTNGVNVDALNVRSSSAIITGADLSGASGGSGGAGVAIFVAGLQVAGYGSNVTASDVSGHANTVSVGFQQFDGGSTTTTRAKVTVSVTSGNFGLYSFLVAGVLFADSVQYIAESFYDLFGSPVGAFVNGIEDGFENLLLRDQVGASPTGVQAFLSRFPLRYAQLLSTPLPRYSLVAMPGGQNGVTLAVADTAAHARLYLGSLNGQMSGIVSPNPVPMHVAYGQVGFCFVDLTGGHGAATAGQPIYLSQTRAGFAQADRPVAGVALKIGIALSASDGTGLVNVLLAGPNVESEDDFFELNLSFGGTAGSNAIPASSTFNLLPTSDAALVFSGFFWEWECPFDTTGMEMWINVLQFSGSTPISASVSVNTIAQSAGAITGISGIGLLHSTAALAVAAGKTVGVQISTPGSGGGATASFTVRLRLR